LDPLSELSDFSVALLEVSGEPLLERRECFGAFALGL
jgi:hypothetical protein